MSLVLDRVQVQVLASLVLIRLQYLARNLACRRQCQQVLATIRPSTHHRVSARARYRLQHRLHCQAKARQPHQH